MKKLLALILAGAMALSLVACGSSEPAAPAEPATKKCPYCMSEIAIEATRCPHCTSNLEA